MVVLETIRDPMSLSDTFSVFFDDGDSSPDHDGVDGDSDTDGERSGGAGSAESKAFWEAQHQLLHESLNRNSSIERRIRTETEEALRDTENGSLRAIRDRLRDAGYDSALCKSKWRRSPDIPSGEHEYVDVVVDPKVGGNRPKSPIRVVIELSFRAEFEMARASEEYNALVRGLPVVFVGKAEKLRGVVKIMCSAAKKCMKENGMHIAPWRKYKYMQSKWFAAACSERMPAAAPELRQKMPKMRASMLTIDLHQNAVEVL